MPLPTEAVVVVVVAAEAEEALVVGEPVGAAVAVLELEPAVAGPLVVAELVGLAPVELAQELEAVAGRVMAVAAILSDILTPVHTDGLTTTGSARECLGFKGATSLGLVAVGLALVTLGLAAPL